MARRYTKKKRTSTRKVARMIVPRVKRAILTLAEKKYYEFQPINTAMTTTWTWKSALIDIVQGTGATQRIGNKIFVHAIRFMVQMKPVVVAGVSQANCRCVVYHNKEAVGALPNTDQVFSTTGVTAQRYIPQLNRYRLLRDQVHNLTSFAYNSTTNEYILGPGSQFQWAIFPKKRIDYTGNGNGITDLFKDDYGFGCIVDTAATCNMNLRVQVIFSDA